MCRTVWMVAAVICSLLLWQNETVAQGQPLPVQKPAFNILVLKPTLNPVTQKWDVGLNGSFANLTAPLLVKFKLRSINLATGFETGFPAPTIVEGTPGMGEQGTIGRNPNFPRNNGTFTGFGAMDNFDVAHRYEMRIEFWTMNAIIEVYNGSVNNGWLAVR